MKMPNSTLRSVLTCSLRAIHGPPLTVAAGPLPTHLLPAAIRANRVGAWGAGHPGPRCRRAATAVNLEVVREIGPVRRPLLEEGVAALGRLVGHVPQPRRFAGKHLLPHEAVVDEVEGELEHALGHGTLAVDLGGPVDRHPL